MVSAHRVTPTSGHEQMVVNSTRITDRHPPNLGGCRPHLKNVRTLPPTFGPTYRRRASLIFPPILILVIPCSLYASCLGPKRAPLPPQSARFRQASQPQRPPTNDKGATSQVQHRSQSQISPSLSNVLPLGPRDQRPTNANSVANNGPPSGPRYPPQNQNYARGEPESSRTMPPSHASGSNDRDRRGERRLSGTAYSHLLAPSESIMDIDVDDHPSTSRIPPSPSSRKPNDEPGLRIGSGMYADRETVTAGDALPRGPRAMAKPLVSTSGSGYTSHSTSPTTPFGYGPSAGGRPRDRSPPPHLQGRGNDGNGRREYEVDPYPPHPMDRGQVCIPFSAPISLR